MTMIVPNAIESATSRFGFFTSAAVKPMLFQASAENSDPTCATPKATNNPNAPLAALTVGKKLFRKDRKSTRLNSSHSQISYAVFCLKKKSLKENRLPPIHL